MHVASAFSCTEIVDCIYNELMRSRDRFIMSKGHGCMIQYVILEEKEGLDLSEYCNGALGCHPDYETQGIEASTGSLGHGLGMALGLAYAGGLDAYCVISDGELQEGSTWEAIMLAASLRVTNLIVCVDYNGWQSLGKMPEDFDPLGKFRAFGWETALVGGHDEPSIYTAIKHRRGERPFALVCNTVKGHGVSYMRDNPIWHYRSPSPTEYQQALAELG